MSAKSIYKSPAGEAVMMKYYDAMLESLKIEYEDNMIETRFGSTHIVVTGPKDAPPLLTLHGGNGNCPLNLSLFRKLASRYRVYAPDTIGFPGKSAQVRPSHKNNDYGQWIIDVLDRIDLEKVPFVTSSYGAGIFLQAAAIAPYRVSHAVLAVPSGIAHGPILPMITKLVMPWLTYSIYPSRSRLIRAFSPMMTEMDEEFLEFCDMLLRNYRMQITGPREVSTLEMRNFTAPVLVIAAKDDIFFPSCRVLPRARELFPNLSGAIEIEGAHLPSRQNFEYICDCILDFLGKTEPNS